MDQQPESPDRALPLEPRHEVVGERDAFERRAEDELAGVEDEGVAVGNLDELGQVLLRDASDR